ncbi:U6 small nuclear RNA (adenine-(43)-N(6))-methyltransferase [Holothuria leucospilota]|uniref:U6 small nuclear RNA (Adenine-(43)-N(6))-methyltransferase n=1 Tax=Holothuria leucospilota TaxID=206669 RepID=A0A9Q1CFI3_HOLLE|nr:U6 small nuclear RNA (adenine-(43)-N(6))-methyltransferase [Holothuria leucospilota]
MCNPPFFGNVLEAQGMLSSRSCKRSEPSSVSTADEVEMIVEGGEVDFIKRMIQESQQVSQRVVFPTWTTTEFCPWQNPCDGELVMVYM